MLLFHAKKIFHRFAKPIDTFAKKRISVCEGPEAMKNPFLPKLSAAAPKAEMPINLVIMHIPFGAANKMDIVHLLSTTGGGIENR